MRCGEVFLVEALNVVGHNGVTCIALRLKQALAPKAIPKSGNMRRIPAKALHRIHPMGVHQVKLVPIVHPVTLNARTRKSAPHFFDGHCHPLTPET